MATSTFVPHRAAVAYSDCCDKPAQLETIYAEADLVSNPLFSGTAPTKQEAKAAGKLVKGEKLGQEWTCTQCRARCQVHFVDQTVPIKAPLSRRLPDGSYIDEKPDESAHMAQAKEERRRKAAERGR